jgi:CDGSH-type Zn-finger protein
LTNPMCSLMIGGQVAAKRSEDWIWSGGPHRKVIKSAGPRFTWVNWRLLLARKNRSDSRNRRRIVVAEDGPYVIHGGLPLVQKTQVVSEHGEPLTWRKVATYDAPETYDLCRCGQSKFKPFCDATHALVDFDGSETADTGRTAERQEVYRGGTGLCVKRDLSLCMEAGFCGNRITNVEEMVPSTEDTEVRSLVMAMIERCPSGSYTYSLEKDGDDVEPDLPQQVAATNEITSEGPINGPLWVTGGVPIERSDGEPFETRNRVTLCRCGHSRIKPLCDGTHRELGEPAAGPGSEAAEQNSGSC